jgi:hypothetical protein
MSGVPHPTKDDLLKAEWNASAPDAHGDVRIEADYMGEDWPIATVRAEYATLILSARQCRRALEKYVQWCQDDRIRQKYANPTQVRDLILEDARAVLKGIIP